MFRGLPILVTVFATFFLLPPISGRLEFSPINAGTNEIRLAIAALFFLISFPLARLAAYPEKRLVV
jgi:ABC-type amino acid transport system permease subunit